MKSAISQTLTGLLVFLALDAVIAKGSGVLHRNGEVASPQDYPLPFPGGIVQSGEKGGHFDDRVVAEFQKAAK